MDITRLILSHAADWESLAEDAERMAVWNDAIVGSGSVDRNKAATYRAVAKSLRLEAETGIPHCSCCLKPRNKAARAAEAHCRKEVTP